ncbi:hypothetical protein GDO81_016180 [Engystomops pustulosus]|uniref:CRC domain-containing protein n=1 Tax=Engystomops pustulosus TaxID=76066 RepID=A0AAV7AWK2_ENGPU|nr:hypothetical protein GDO81_016180 [Engystomops pustulosus]
MENYRYSHFDGFGNLMPGTDITQDFRPFPAYHNDITHLLDYYLHPFSGLIHPASASDHTGESLQNSYRPSNDQHSHLSTTVQTPDFGKTYFTNMIRDNSRRLIPEHPYPAQSDSRVLGNGDSKILYVNNPDTGELKSYQVLSQPQEQHHMTPNPDHPDPPVLRGFLPLAPTRHFTIHDMDSRTVYTLTDDVACYSDLDMEGALDLALPDFMLDTKSKRPCSCSKTQCLKLYCECFANGEHCNSCNCSNCYNNMYHEMERCKAIKAYLERNPEAFQPKIGKLNIDDVKPRHTKGCNCKRSGCLKNYCECYECSSVFLASQGSSVLLSSLWHFCIAVAFLWHLCGVPEVLPS